MKTIAITVLAGLLLALGIMSGPALAKDLPGSKDHPLVKRYEGSEILKYEQKQYDSRVMALGRAENSKKLEKAMTVEGTVTRLTYKAPEGRSSLEVLRNYENELKAEGYEVLFYAGKEQLGSYFAEAAGYGEIQWPPNVPGLTLNGDSHHYSVLRKQGEGGGEVYVAVYAVQNKFWASNLKEVKKEQVLVQVDVVETKPMEAKMVTVTSEEMAQTMAAAGGVALYGIYFDFNKAELKPESEPTLKEIAKLLEGSSGLKVLVVGHTDSVGSFESNQDLSQRRAEAVVKALVGNHGLDGRRLKAVGVSFSCPKATNQTEEGRARNRRVELVEF
jgi:outer membrane protein OmpA-like peptidoglycan-associated protein